MKQEWTKTWFQIFTTEELQTKLLEAKDCWKQSQRSGQESVALMWQFRIKRLQEELSDRSRETPLP